MKAPTVRVLDGSTFAVSDPGGDMALAENHLFGVFYRDVRHLSQWQLRVNGRPLDPLMTRNLEYDDAAFWLVAGTGTIYRDADVTVTRRRELRSGMREHIAVRSYGSEPVVLELSVLFDADFADIFEVKDQLPKKGHVTRHIDHDSVVLTYERDDFHRRTRIRAPGAHLTGQSLTYSVTASRDDPWHADLDVVFESGDGDSDDGRVSRPRRQRGNMERPLDEWLDSAPQLECEWDDLRHTYQRSLVDLAALRFYPPGMQKASLPAAGLPWFMALFGRDALISSYQALPFVPELARTTLRALAARQATDVDDFRDAEPGKILHELRHGEMVYFGERPQSPYYGSADGTMLFLILLDEYERWSGDGATVRELEGPARAAIRWMEDYGDLDGDGYIEYRTRNPESGLVNQCWKDSWNSIVHPDGRLATLPRATCELQGYAYDARRRAARLARECWNDHALAERLERDADELRRRFNRDFWVGDGDFFALALEGDKRRVATRASNMGQLLWSGVVDDDHAATVAQQVLSGGLFSGWGIRTVAADQDAYNPIGYHRGTVWPHDTSLIALGLATYGFRAEAAVLGRSLLETASYFDHRLPEAFAGFDRAETAFPVEYPTACSPQAWATGAPLLILRVLLGLTPTPDGLHVDPCVPDDVGEIRLTGVPGRWGRANACSVTASRRRP